MTERQNVEASRDELAEAADIVRSRPRSDAASIGRALATLAAAGRRNRSDLSDPCATCAFRFGCMTNAMPPTVLVALRCTIGIDEGPFHCHHGVAGDQPTRECVGWKATQAADASDLQRMFDDLTVAFDTPYDRASDPVLTGFDAWIQRIDPNGRLDDHQRGRLWLRDDPCGLMAAARSEGRKRHTAEPFSEQRTSNDE